jgi:hypothetical protein
MLNRVITVASFIGYAAITTISVPAQAAHVLITEEEAKLPPPKGAIALDLRGITRGPKINFVAIGESVHSPMHFQLKFESYGGAKISPPLLRMPSGPASVRLAHTARPSNSAGRDHGLRRAT